MKKQYRYSIPILILGLAMIAVSCIKEEIPIVQDLGFELNSKLQVQESTDLVSDLLFKMGVSGINVEKLNDQYKFNCITVKGFFLNGRYENLSDYDFILKDGLLSIDGKHKQKITVLNDQPFMISKDYAGSIEEFNKTVFDSEIGLLLIFLKEITLTNKLKGNNHIEIIDPKGCSFWDTYYVFGLGFNSSASESTLDSEIERYDLSNCSAIGNASTSCLWGSHGCVSSQAYCCQD